MQSTASIKPRETDEDVWDLLDEFREGLSSSQARLFFERIRVGMLRRLIEQRQEQEG